MSTGSTGRERVIALALTGLVALSVLFAGARAAVGSWVPHTDNAYFTVRSLDVATRYHPLLGAWSSGTADVAVDVNNLGPLQLYLLAPFTKIAPMGGTAIGVVAVHVLAILTIAWLVHRIGGWRSVIPAMTAVALLTWVMGSEMLITPQQHQYLMLPYLCVLVSAWAAAAGDRWALVPFVVAGTLVCQTHLSYPILVAGVGLPAVVGQVLAARRTGGIGPFRRPWTIAAVTGLILWSPAVIDQFFGWGNVTNVLRSPGETSAPGWGTAVRIVSAVLADPRGYFRPGFRDYGPLATLAGNPSVVLFVLMWAALAVGAAATFRRHRRTATAGFVVAFLAVTAGVVDAAQLPPIRFGLAAANYRWLWPTATFLVIGALIAVERATRRYNRSIGPIGFAAAAVVLLALNVPTSQQMPQSDEYVEGERATSEMVRQLASAELEMFDGPVVIDQSRMGFGHPFAYVIAAVLLDHGVDFRLDGDRQARRFGEGRVSDGTEHDRLLLVRGDEAEAVRGDDAVLAFVDGPDPVALVLVDNASSPDPSD
ncbi:hypothetical protein [Ilumatobacter sp.]|uniref:hypothetical protein n=1 Tax=Ilumatobacter sp. TaxID=1967498 RepID=UPI003C3AE0D6